jgi:N-acyl-D-amino-acid deacylase
VDIAADTYAYTAWFNTFSAFIPPWAHDGGDAKLIQRLKDPATRARIRKDMETPSTTWDNEWNEIPGAEAILVSVVQNSKLLPLEGKTIAEIAQLWKKDPIDTIFDLLIEDNAATQVAVFGMSEPDVRLALQQPWISVCNDSQGTAPDGLLGLEHPHPRAYGTFPRILRKYVREDGALTLPDAIRKFSALPAARLRLADRGSSKPACGRTLWFSIPTPSPISPLLKSPTNCPQACSNVLVNGVPVIEHGQMTNALPGKVVRGSAWRP